jgi:putative membrane protein
LNVTLGNLLKLLTLPITVLTLGISALLLNGLMFWLASRFVDGFYVGSFWWAVLGAILVSVTSAMLNRIFLGADGKWGGN